MNQSSGLRVIDACSLPASVKALLKPGEQMTDRFGRSHLLPRFFYAFDSWEQAKATLLTPHFTLSELTTVDCREDRELLEGWPHYVPCAISILARYLELFREKVGSPVYICANGGYRSPAHRLTRFAGPHNWGTAANIYKIGEVFLDERSLIQKYAQIAASIGPEIFVKPYGHNVDQTDDHLHLDLGYVCMEPHGVDKSTFWVEENEITLRTSSWDSPAI